MKFQSKTALFFIALGINLFSQMLWQIKGQTNFIGFISLLLMLSALPLVLFFLLKKQRIISPTIFTNLLLCELALAVILLGVEIFFRCAEKDLQSHMKKNGSYNYQSAYLISLNRCDSCAGGLFFINRPYSTDNFYKNEFSYPSKYNSLGLRDSEFNLKKDSNEYRILGLGDSFTEGIGTSADSTWLKQVEYLLNGRKDAVHYTTLNGGVHGSDLFFSYDLFTHCLLKYKPDLVILNLNSTDINDIVCRGGQERFDKEGNLQNKNRPSFEFLFGSSYLARFVMLRFLHFNWQVLAPQQQAQEDLKALAAIENKLKDFQALALHEHFRFVLVTHPLQNELSNSVNTFAQLKPDTSIQQIDLTEILKEKISSSSAIQHKYYWPVDGHFKTLGYGLEATTIAKTLF